MSMYDISVIVPVYNAEQYLNRCIDSILGQTFGNYELILIDDGSSDHSGIICDAYAHTHTNVYVIHQTNQGQAAARNNGVKAASGQWIAFIDADDFVHPYFLEILYKSAYRHNANISICCVFEGETPPDTFYNDLSMESEEYSIDEHCLLSWVDCTDDHISPYAYWIVCAKLIRKSILNKFPFTANRIYEDNAIVFKWLHEAGKVAFCNDQMYFYFVNPNGTTKCNYSLKRLDWLWAVQEQITFYKDIGYTKLELVFRKRYIWEALREYEHIRMYLNDRNSAKKLRTQIISYWIFNRKKLSMSYSERMDILSRLYPNAIRLLSSIRRYLKG